METPRVQLWGMELPMGAPKARSYGICLSLRDRAEIFASPFYSKT